jgi:hypothetical protein
VFLFSFTILGKKRKGRVQSKERQEKGFSVPTTIRCCENAAFNLKKTKTFEKEEGNRKNTFRVIPTKANNGK